MNHIANPGWPHDEAQGLPEDIKALYYTALNASYDSDCWPQSDAKDQAAMDAWQKYEDAKAAWKVAA